MNRQRSTIRKYPEGVTENGPGLRRAAGRYPGYRPQINKFPLPFRRGEGQGEGSDLAPLIILPGIHTHMVRTRLLPCDAFKRVPRLAEGLKMKGLFRYDLEPLA
jgi:hypothetical protein